MTICKKTKKKSSFLVSCQDGYFELHFIGVEQYFEDEIKKRRQIALQLFSEILHGGIFQLLFLLDLIVHMILTMAFCIKIAN